MPRTYGTTNVKAVASAPPIGVVGEEYWDTTAKNLNLSDGAVWNPIPGHPVAPVALAAPADNAPPLNTSFNFASSNYEYIPAGVYNLKTVLNGTAGRFVGAGQDRTILRLDPTSTAGAWLVANIARFELESLTIDLNAPNTVDQNNVGLQYGLQVQAISGTSVFVGLRHVKIINSWHRGLWLAGNSTATPMQASLYDVTISNCGQSSTADDAMVCAWMNNATMVGLFVNNNPITGATTAAAVFNSCSNVTIDDFQVNNNGKSAGNGEGLAFTVGGTNVPCSYLELSNGQCNGNNGNWGLAVSVHSSNVKLNNIQANNNPSGGGITLDVLMSGDTSCWPAYASVVNCEGSGNGTFHGLNLNYIQYVNVSNGQFNGNTGATACGISISGMNCCVSNCHAHGNQVRGLMVNSTTGVAMGAHTIVGNDLTGNVTGSFLEQASPAPTPSFVKNNQGYNPVGTLTVTVPASGTAVAATSYDRSFYVTAGSSTCTMAIQGGPSVVVPASALANVRVPAGQTVTPTYTTAPTWVVEGE